VAQPVTTHRNLVDCRVTLPEHWTSWPPGDAATRLRDVVDPLVDGEEARETLESAVLWCDEHNEQDGLFTLGLWIPDPATGVPAGVLTGVLAAVPPGPDPAGTLLAMARRPPRGHGMKVLHYDKSLSRVNAGPAVLELATIATKATREIVAHAIWTIVPPGSDSAVVLTVRTSDLALTQSLVAQSTLIAQSVEVDLGPSQ